MNPENKEKRLRRPLLVTTSNHHFITRCIARSYHLQNFDKPVYIKEFLKQDEREIEKQISSKRYQMIHSGGKDRKLFRIKNLKFYYDNTLVPVDSN